MKVLVPILLIGVLFISCNNGDSDEINELLTDALVEKGLKYGTESRQFLDL